MLAWAYAIGILGLSAPTSCSSKFIYSRSTNQSLDECHVCFEKDCQTIDKARCDYYAEADSLLPKDVEEPGGIEDAAKKKEVDDLVHNLVNKELSTIMECIPYVSRYTNCNKDNVCLGCKTCACNPDGMWNCTTVHPCHGQHPPLKIDHRVLVIIMEALTDSSHPKKTKRSVSDHSKEKSKKDITTMSDEKLYEMLYVDTSSNVQETSSTVSTSTTDFTIIEPEHETVTETAIATTKTDPTSTLSGLITTEVAKAASSSADADYLAFDEVLRNIAVDINNYNRRKSLDNLINNQTFNIDYVMLEDVNNTSDAPNDRVMNLTLNDKDNVTSDETLANATKVMIDLIETASRLDANANGTQDNTNFNKDDYLNIFENNDILDFNTLNIMKRDVTLQENTVAPNVEPTVTVTKNAANTTNENVSEETQNLKEKVIIPLNKIIAEKIKEFESLQTIKENLLKFLKIDEKQLDENGSENNITNTFFFIPNNTIASGFDGDLRRAHTKKYEKYMYKLKTDIFEVIRDIIGIQKNKDSEIPRDLKLLMRAMKGYVYKNQLIEKPNTLPRFRESILSFRRNIEHSSGQCDGISFNDCLLLIIKAIDKDMPNSNALFPLSSNSRKIINHVIKSYYIDHVAIPGVHDPHYSLAHYLNSIGSKWQEATVNLLSSTPFASLHRMKLLHCFITLDIGKMNDALSLIEFARNRRMVSSLDNVNDDTIDKIDAGLMAIHSKVRLLIQHHEQSPLNKISQADVNETTSKSPPPTTMKNPSTTRKKANHSFIKHIRTLLKASKKDIAQFLHKDVPKSEIVKQLAKKRLHEMTDKRYGEYEETMKRWQRNLEIIPRVKRSNLNLLLTRTKNIIPKYLRRKVNPRIKNWKKIDVKKKKNISIRDRILIKKTKS